MDPLAEILLRRRRLVALRPLAAGDTPVPTLRPSSRRRKSRVIASPTLQQGVQALEAQLLEYGFLLSPDLRDALGRLDAGELTRAGRRLAQAVLAELGGHVEHVPMFRGFPESVPADTAEFFVRRMFAVLLQYPEQPCVLCGKAGSVHAVSPCAHLVCHACWDGSDFAGCPICHRRIDPADPFLRPSAAPADTAVPPPCHRLVLLSLCEDPPAVSGEILDTLLARRTPLSPQDRADVVALVRAGGPETAGRLPERIPVRETRAAVLAALLPVLDAAAVRDLLDRHVDTATDVLRLLYALMGGDPGLRTRLARRASLPRPVRRALLARLDTLALPSVVADLHRHAEAWKRMAEVLHPHEFHRRHPTVALAFAVLRGTPLTGELGKAMLERAAGYPEVLRVEGARLRLHTFAGRVEAALRAGEPVLPLLAARPGELVRRLGQVLGSGEKGAAETVAAAAPHVAPGVLIAALGGLRTPPGGTRLFFPRGDTARAWAQPDERPELPAGEVAPVLAALTAELLRRAAALPPLGRVLLDEGLDDLIAPTAERSDSAALVRMPRGSVQPLPRDERIRLFLHWAEPGDERVDLDLSVALYDARWKFVGLCDYTDLRLGRTAAVHSGDLTSAPEPLGASEFVDLNVTELLVLGGRYAVPVVFSFDDVPFDRLVRGFAGFMSRPAGLFDPRAVEQRFDLTGSARIHVPLVADLWSRTMRWVDLNQSSTGYGHNVAGNHRRLALLGSAMEDAYGLAERVTLWEVACWHATARAEEVLTRRPDGSVSRYARRAGEDVPGFADRLLRREDDGPWRGPVDGADLAVLVHADVEPPAGSQLYALYPWSVDTDRVDLLDAADLVGLLAPEPAG
ncbi:MXAN_6230/SCO0854 family RING domain-containing protein [Streptosporangium canum]|uniref:MXAN_6230/SCO0854 family RING domain-containing protein n=1 Tax=Streptosporangium canum TaxID=324952 RepID=UPI0037B35FC7